jgi:hypothetical protein
VNEAAEDLVALNATNQGSGGDRHGNLQLEAPMWARRIVVVDVDVQDPFQLAVRDNEQVVEALGPQALDPALGVGVCSRGSDRGADRGDAFTAQHVVEGGGELGITVRTKKRTFRASSWRLKTRLRAIWAIHRPLGCVVIPRRRTTRVSISITKSP